MIYIVSGFMRSGTSMMMRAIEAGGLEAVYSKARDAEMNARWGEDGYVPNESYYELGVEDYCSPNFPAKYDGKLIKCLIGGLLRIPPTACRVVVMRRPAKEIGDSLYAAFDWVPPQVETGHFDSMVDRMVDVLRDRRSFVSVDEVAYREVVADPLTVFQRLAQAWPIDPVKAAAIPSRNETRIAA